MKTAEHQIVTRIGFAERWLQRAREECLDGDVTRGLLTLVLADAEMRRVLQLAVAPAPRPRTRTLPALTIGVGLVMAVAVALQLGVLALGAAPPESAALAPGLLLRPGTGALLGPLGTRLLEEPVRVVAAPLAPALVQPAVARRNAAARAARPSPVAVPQEAATMVIPVIPPAPPSAPVAGPPTPTAPAPAPAAAPAPAGTSVSGVDLLDLVIVADRTLRRSQP